MYNKEAIAHYFAVTATKSLLLKIISENFAGYGL